MHAVLFYALIKKYLKKRYIFNRDSLCIQLEVEYVSAEHKPCILSVDATLLADGAAAATDLCRYMHIATHNYRTTQSSCNLCEFYKCVINFHKFERACSVVACESLHC